MKYKYSRSNRINKFIKNNNYSISPEESELFADLLATKEVEKEWVCPNCHKTGCICWKKNPFFNKSSPSPLDKIEEIEEMKHVNNFLKYELFHKTINTLIRNQNRTINYLKSK